MAERVVMTRLALGYPVQADLCRAIGVEPNRWNQYEGGGTPRRRITLAVVEKLKRRFGVTSDWIYFGDLRGLPRELADKLYRDAAE